MTQASHPEGTTVKETKAQKAERLKREKNPWAAFDEIRRFAAEGRGSVLPEWAGLYFKWWGIYTQGDGVGALGGVGGEGKATEYFMLRIPVSNGILSSAQARHDRGHSASSRAQSCRHHGPAGDSASLADRSKACPRSSSGWMLWGFRRVGHAAMSFAMSQAVRWRDWRQIRSSTRRRLRFLLRERWPAMPSFTICHASSRFP